MSHIDQSTLRRLLDEPLAISDTQRRHLDTCDHCRSRAEAAAIDARAAATTLAVPEGVPDVEAALARVRAAGGSPAARHRPSLLDRIAAAIAINPGRSLRPVGALAVAVGLAAVLVVSGTAQSMLSVFEPKTVTPVAISPQLASFRGIPDLSAYGTVNPLQNPHLSRAVSAADASAQSGLAILVPGTLPRDASTTPSYYVMSHFNASFTFDAAKARAAAAALGRTLPPLPSGLDGTTLALDAGPGVATTYATANTAAVPAAGGGDIGSLLASLPELAVVQMKTPTVTSAGLSVRDLEHALLSMPGIPSELKAQIKAIGDPATTLPIPIPTSGVTSKQVAIQGVSGLALGDNTGIGSAVIWIKNGEVFAVAAQASVDEVVAVGRSMH
ncbi:MAG TPA: hypothetical protein VG245_07110 [Candidatus Dormibacteraeota bacterium]|jgi:hypothetical protein|nr:hypothetical protein [Candidatus Dormibacteraeota bacterium]